MVPPGEPHGTCAPQGRRRAAAARPPLRASRAPPRAQHCACAALLIGRCAPLPAPPPAGAAPPGGRAGGRLGLPFSYRSPRRERPPPCAAPCSPAPPLGWAALPNPWMKGCYLSHAKRELRAMNIWLLLSALVYLQRCLSTSTREQGSSKTHIFYTVEIDGDSNTASFLAKQHGMQFISKHWEMDAKPHKFARCLVPGSCHTFNPSLFLPLKGEKRSR
ncbi:uncharacterized protein LOC128851626 [Cuculus canorus]|uniref:uncharacterized protein LOC128851626 n=1 Tax=Cuculus canorus TaxID=55661 RepID=UPI0023AB1EC4|nr:uncharacterized protein LOC128851626 [Cuculus canorus]